MFKFFKIPAYILHLRFTTGGILKWYNFDFLVDLLEESEGIINITQLLSGSALVMLIFGGFLIGVSLIGLIGACCSSRVFLIVYEIILALVFVVTLIILILGMNKGNELKTKYRNRMTNAVVRHFLYYLVGLLIRVNERMRIIFKVNGLSQVLFDGSTEFYERKLILAYLDK